MKKAERLLSLLLVLALASACIPAAAETKNVRTLFSMRTVELLTADGLTVTAGGEVREEYTEGRKKRPSDTIFPFLLQIPQINNIRSFSRRRF